ncbi:MAG: gliding motility-associated C-terminal domain-containing protein [Flavobacteriales bacterium]|nr:gliding motility-associated C-terminal domain-containing protein [Flavobacteriales bacterium]
MISFLGSYAQSPQVNCLSVAPNGNVTINWTPSTGLGTMFVQYNVYSDASGSYSIEGSVSNVSSSVYVHAGANANVGSVSYYVTVVYNNGATDIELPPLDTLSTIFLDVNNPSDGTAILQWSDLGSPINGNNGNYYYIQQQINGGAWTLYDSVLISDNNYYRDTISVCSANINYQVYLNNSEGCQSLSNIDGDLFEDLIPPDSPVMASVTVDTTTGNAFLVWHPSTSQDASAYIIMQNNGGVWMILDTVYGYSDTTYLNGNSNADLISEMYGVAAFDSCWNGNPPAPNTSPLGTPHVSMFAQTTYAVCDHQITLKWNSYRNWNAGVLMYNIYRSDNGGNYLLVHSEMSGDSSYSENVPYGQEYCYIIEAVSSNGMDTSISNIACRYARQPNSPKYAYIQTVTVEDDYVTVKMHPDQTGTTREIELFRSDDGINYSSVYSETVVSSTVIYQDIQVDPAENSYWYKYTVRDSCENVILTSNESRNIQLSASSDQNTMVNFIQWNSYKNWNGNLLQYELYRSVNDVFDPSPIAVLSPSELYYEDDISDLIGTDADGYFCYYVQAVESSNVYGISEISVSNEACTSQNSLVFIPNAMVVGGNNGIWRPVINLIDFDSYECKVYNRLGQLIFNANSPDIGWDGTHKNGSVELGVYIYQVTFFDGAGQEYDYWGSITLIR